MTRKHFQRLAQLMRVHKPDDNRSSEYQLWSAMLEDLIVELREMNRIFDEDLFRAWVNQ